jgi:hypothetical protein
MDSISSIKSNFNFKKNKTVLEKLREYKLTSERSFKKTQEIKIGLTKILYNKIQILFCERTNEKRISYVKYFKPKKYKGLNVGLVQTYTTYKHNNETRVLRYCDLYTLDEPIKLLGHTESSKCVSLVKVYHLLPS